MLDGGPNNDDLKGRSPVCAESVNQFALIDQYMELPVAEYLAVSVDDLSTIRFFDSQEEEIARDIASLVNAGYLNAMSFRDLTKDMEVMLGSIPVPDFISKDDFVVEYNKNTYPEPKVDLPVFEKGSAHFTNVINVFMRYLTEHKGEKIKCVRLSEAPVNGDVYVPEGVVNCDLSQTNVDSGFLGPRSLKSLWVSGSHLVEERMVDSSIDLSHYDDLQEFSAYSTQIDDTFVPPTSLKKLYLSNCPCGDAVPLHEGLEDYSPGRLITSKKYYPRSLRGLRLQSCENLDGPLEDLPKLKLFVAQGKTKLDPRTRFRYGLRELDLSFLGYDISELRIPESVEEFSFTPDTIEQPEVFYERLPEHLRRGFNSKMCDYLLKAMPDELIRWGCLDLSDFPDDPRACRFPMTELDTSFFEACGGFVGKSEHAESTKYEVRGDAPVGKEDRFESLRNRLLNLGVPEARINAMLPVLDSGCPSDIGITTKTSTGLVFSVDDRDGKRIYGKTGLNRGALEREAEYLTDAWTVPLLRPINAKLIGIVDAGLYATLLTYGTENSGIVPANNLKEYLELRGQMFEELAERMNCNPSLLLQDPFLVDTFNRALAHTYMRDFAGKKVYQGETRSMVLSFEQILERAQHTSVRGLFDLLKTFKPDYNRAVRMVNDCEVEHAVPLLIHGDALQVNVFSSPSGVYTRPMGDPTATIGYSEHVLARLESPNDGSYVSPYVFFRNGLEQGRDKNFELTGRDTISLRRKTVGLGLTNAARTLSYWLDKDRVNEATKYANLAFQNRMHLQYAS